MARRAIKGNGLILTIVCVMAVLAGCGGGSGGTASTGNISGYVYVPVGGVSRAAGAPAGYEPLQGADVACEGITYTTKSNGYYILTGVPAGTNKTVTISKTGYGTITRTGITVTAGGTTVATREDTTDGLITLTSSGSISVTSTPDSATVYIDSKDTGVTTPHTFDGVSPGDHAVRVTLAGYTVPATQTVAVTSGSTSSVSFTLKKRKKRKKKPKTSYSRAQSIR